MTLIDEIRQQPAVQQALLSERWSEVEVVAAWVREQRPRYVFLAGRGTSCHAGYYATYLWGARNRLPVAIAAPSLFGKYHSPPAMDGALVVGISQSGQSPDVVGVLEEARRQGRPTLAIVNDPDSPMARSADRVLAIGAGEERQVAATKTYTAQLMAIAMLSVALGDDAQRRAQLQQVPELMRQALQLEAAADAAAAATAAMERCVVIGRGFDYATTHEWSLKLKELAYVVAERYSSADFRHGPIAVVARGFPVLAVAARGAVSDDLVELLQKLRGELDAELVVVSNEPAALQVAARPLALPAMPEWISPLVSILPCQLFAYHLTRHKGLDPHAPRGLRKVTKTD